VNTQAQKFTIMNFASRLADLIDRRALTQRTIALECSISAGALTQYLQGRIPKAEELYRLARYFNVSMEFLLTGNEAAFPETTVVTEAGLEEWRTRAKEAERKVDILKAGANGLLNGFHDLLKKI
jgi:transcriptional regulator with XRE-family HTH domain